MYNILLTIHVLVTLALIGVILMQNSASDSTGLTGSSSSSFLSGRAAATAVTRLTTTLAALFICTSLGLGIITARSHSAELSVIDRLGHKTSPTIPAAVPDSTAPVAPNAPATPTAPAAPAKPSVPRPE